MEQASKSISNRVLHWFSMSSAGPGRVATLWLINALLCIFDAAYFPGGDEGFAIPAGLVAAMPIFAGLLASWALHLRSSALRLIAIFCVLSIAAECLWLGAEFRGLPEWLGGVFSTTSLIASALVIWFVFAGKSRKRRTGAIAVLVAVYIGAPGFYGVGVGFMHAWERQQASASDDEGYSDPMGGITADELWEAQPDLVVKQADGLKPRIADRPNVYAVAIAALGTQELFSREATLALDVLAHHYGGDYRGGMLLSNGKVDLLKRPLATQANMAAATQALHDRVDPAKDIAFIYLASHGGRDAELATGLPNYEEVRPISADSVADALKEAGIKRRIVVVSACFAASWIPALASDDTIIISAAAKDRTSFGCDDSRQLTYFGEAFLKGPLAKGASLEQAFTAAKQSVARWEAKDKLTPSMPQASIGKNMRAIWTQPAAR